MANGGYTVVLFNRSAEPAAISVDFTELGMASTTRVHVRDLLAHVDLPDAVGSFSAVVASHSVRHVNIIQV